MIVNVKHSDGSTIKCITLPKLPKVGDKINIPHEVEVYKVCSREIVHTKEIGK